MSTGLSFILSLYSHAVWMGDGLARGNITAPADQVWERQVGGEGRLAGCPHRSLGEPEIRWVVEWGVLGRTEEWGPGPGCCRFPLCVTGRGGGGYPKDQRETESLPHLASYPGSPHSPDSQCLLLLAAEVLPSEGWKGNGEV